MSENAAPLHSHKWLFDCHFSMSGWAEGFLAFDSTFVTVIE